MEQGPPAELSLGHDRPTTGPHSEQNSQHPVPSVDLFHPGVVFTNQRQTALPTAQATTSDTLDLLSLVPVSGLPKTHPESGFLSALHHCPRLEPPLPLTKWLHSPPPSPAGLHAAPAHSCLPRLSGPESYCGHWLHAWMLILCTVLTDRTGVRGTGLPCPPVGCPAHLAPLNGCMPVSLGPGGAQPRGCSRPDSLQYPKGT